MIFKSCRLQLKLSNAQILCPKNHKLRVIILRDGKEVTLYCKKCKQYYPFPGVNDALCEGEVKNG